MLSHSHRAPPEPRPIPALSGAAEVGRCCPLHSVVNVQVRPSDVSGCVALTGSCAVCVPIEGDGLLKPSVPTICLVAALRKSGWLVVKGKGKRFLDHVPADKPLMLRTEDIVGRAVYLQCLLSFPIWFGGSSTLESLPRLRVLVASKVQLGHTPCPGPTQCEIIWQLCPAADLSSKSFGTHGRWICC